MLKVVCHDACDSMPYVSPEICGGTDSCQINKICTSRQLKLAAYAVQLHVNQRAVYRNGIWTAVPTHVVAMCPQVSNVTAVTCSIANLHCRTTATMSVVPVTVKSVALTVQKPQGKESSHSALDV